jgi:hypothetical protein
VRRTTPFLAIGPVVVGLELSTKAASVTAARLSSGFQDAAVGLDSLVSPTRFVAGVSMLAIGLVVGVVQMILEGVEGRVSAVGDTCPVCDRQTERMKRKRFAACFRRSWGESSPDVVAVSAIGPAFR